MQTSRDAQIVDWIGRLGAASAEDVMARFQMGRSWAYARLSALVADRLLIQRTLLHRQPGLYLATAEGLRWRGLQRLGVYRVGPGSFEHACQVAATATALHVAQPGWRILSEREIRAQEADHGELVASIKLGELPGRRAALASMTLAECAGPGDQHSGVDHIPQAHARSAQGLVGSRSSRRLDHGVFSHRQPRRS
jgi:hypothetical protein